MPNYWIVAVSKVHPCVYTVEQKYTERERERCYTWAQALACVTNKKICIEEDEMYVTLE